MDNSNLSKSKNYSKKKSQLIIPDAAVDEQIINREIDLNGDGNQENINNFEKINININKNLSNNNFNDDEGISKEELIFVGDSNEEDEYDNKINYYKSHSSSQKPFLYISNSILDDQIINRQLIKNGDEQNENENWENIINKNSNEKGSELININENEDVEEEEILFFNYGNNENDKKDFSREKTNKNNKCLYIQFSSIDDQITDRKVNINENDIKKIKNIMKREDSKPYIRKKVDPNKNVINSAKKDVNTYKFLDNENDNLKESEIFINNRLNTEGNEMKTKISKSSLKIFVPEYVIEDQFVNREVCPDNN